MNVSQTGKFYGQTNQTIQLGGITLTDTEYTNPKVDWHYHENAYFTFILQGNVIEGNKKEIYECTPGSLLFHNWQEPHYNIKPDGFTRGFHVEIDHRWFADSMLDISNLQGSLNISHPDVKLLLYKIFRETKIDDSVSDVSVRSLLTEAFSRLTEIQRTYVNPKPSWVAKVDEVLHDRFAEPMTLDYLSGIANIHPVHLSRDFSKYFGCTLADYIRKIRVEKALSLMPERNLSLSEIAHRCGFFDQSHFIRCFKELNGLNPGAHKKLLR
ncbi:MAG: AraC family transcriptional regulator [Flavobacterium sp.]|uniref:helix-turn-helix domain-containing protein n=1 Tax=Flavobacterium sp. TaxID=239 RepID=UPI0012231EB8|nr:AraC family transcriptional regulator [Flavobacterium sp.]RZJ66928.1 MAG: AraC family transcriptional regulator [Flavobacterium sp.]